MENSPHCLKIIGTNEIMGGKVGIEILSGKIKLHRCFYIRSNNICIIISTSANFHNEQEINQAFMEGNNFSDKILRLHVIASFIFYNTFL